MKIAILLATYNSEHYIRELLDSLLAQTFQDFVIYVHDDGSIDETLTIIKDYKKRNPEKFNLLEYSSTGSSKANFLSMLKYVEEPYVMFCDHDDVWLKDKIEVSMEKMIEAENENNSVPVLIFSDLTVVDNELREISPSFMKYTGLNPKKTQLNNLLVENVVAGCTIMMNSSLTHAVLELQNYNNILMHDLWCALVASAIGKIEYINRSLILYRQHGDNVKGADAKPSFVKRVSIVIHQLLDGTMVSSNKRWHKYFRLQALELSKLSSIPENKRNMCIEYASLAKCNKIQRVIFYLKHNIRREKNNLWLLLWC